MHQFRSVLPHARTRRSRCRPASRVWFDALEDRCLLATFTVANTNAFGTGSLAQAIIDANAAAGADLIQFDIAGTGPHTIAPALPAITDPVTIDGYTQPGASPNTLAVGSNAVLLFYPTTLAYSYYKSYTRTNGGPGAR